MSALWSAAALPARSRQLLTPRSPGAFYAFELIIGAYTLQTLAPVGLAALTGALVVRGLRRSRTRYSSSEHEITISASDYLGIFALGIASAGLGIAVMKGVTSTEALFRRQAVPRWARPALGGLLVGALALVFPQILGSGHGGILQELHSGFDLTFLAGFVARRSSHLRYRSARGFAAGCSAPRCFLAACSAA